MTIAHWIFLALAVYWVVSCIQVARLMKQNPDFAPWRDEGEPAAVLSATIENWPSKDQLATILNEAGIETTVGTNAIRLAACPSFVFRDFDRPVASSISGDHDSVEGLRDITAKVSKTLAQHGIRHRFEVYDADGKRVAEHSKN